MLALYDGVNAFGFERAFNQMRVGWIVGCVHTLHIIITCAVCLL